MRKSVFFILFTLSAITSLYSDEISSDDALNTAAQAAALPAPKSETMIGVGAGMSIGSVPLFTLWQSSLPDSMSRIGLTPDFGIDMDEPASPNSSMNLKYAVTEAPEKFNIIFPLTLSVYNLKNDRIATLGVSFFYTSKQFQSMIYPELDTLMRRVNIDEKLSLYSFTLEAGYQKAIPPEYFSISGSQKTLFSMSLAASPFNMFTRSGKVRTSVPESDERMRAAADSARKNFSDLSSNGKALSWRLGVTTLRNYGNSSAIEMGLFYGGSYSALFYDGSGSRTRKSHIHITEDERDKNLTFLQNRIELRMTFLRSLNRERTRSDSMDGINNDKNDLNNDMDDES